MKKATFLKDLPGFTGTAKLYRMEPPLAKARFVAVSAAVAMFSGPETYIFPADAKGKVTDWGELDGSYRGGLSHETALRNAGYSVVAPRKKAKARK